MQKTVRILISLLLSLVCLMTVFSSAAYAMSEEEAVNKGYDIFTAWHRQTYSSYHYMVYDYISPYKPTVEKNESSAVYQSLLFAWRAATFNISSEAGYAEKEVAYYESFIFDMFYDEDSGSFFQTLIKEAKNYNKLAEKELKALGASVEKKVAESLLAISHEYADSIPAGGWDVDKLTEAYGIISCATEVKDACKIITKVTDFFKYAKTGSELLENICKMQAVLNSAGKIRGILEDLINRTAFSNPALKQALTELKTCMACPFTQYDFVPLLLGKTTVTEMTKEFGKKAWSGVLECLLGAYGKAVEAGQAAGTFLADRLLNTSDSIAAYYKLRALYRFEEELKSYIRSIEKNALASAEQAQKFDIAVTMLYKTYINGIDIFKSYLQKTYREGAFNLYFPGIDDIAYQKMCSSLDNLKKTISDCYMVNEELSEEMYQNYVKSYQYKPVPMKEKIENYNENIELLERTDYSFRNTVRADWTLTCDVTIYGDLTVTAGVLDLNGHTMTVYGNLIQSGGTVNCNGGTLHITGDYRVQTPQINGDGEITGYGYSVGRLQMTKAADQIIVGGSFYTSSSDSSIYTIFSAGTMTIGRDFYQYGNSHNFNTSGTHAVVFKGKGEHIVWLEGASAHFTTVKTEKDATLLWRGTCNLTLQSPLTIKDNGITVQLIDLNGSTLTVDGDFTQTSGLVKCSGGTLHVTGDYRIQTPKKNGDGEIVDYEKSNGLLQMTKAADKILIDGSFYTSSTGNLNYIVLSAGTMTIGKNFYQYNQSSSNFMATDAHTVVFKGSGEHVVCFEGAGSRFATVSADTGATLVWNGYCDLTLQNPLTIKDNGMTIQKIDLNGKTLTVDGNLTQTAGLVNCNGGTLYIRGDYRIQTPKKNGDGEIVGYGTSTGSLQMTKAKDKIMIDGSFYASFYRNSGNAFTAGTMTISENFYQDGQLKFVAKDAHKVVLGGTGSHTVVCDGLGSQFNILELTQGCENYTFTPAKCWNSIITVSHVDKDKDGVCDVCGTECGAAHQHDFSVLKSDETSHWYQCTGCEEIKDKAAHTWDGGKVAKPAACTEEGVKTFTCTVCQATKTEPIPATGHRMTKTEAKPATCTEPGNVAYYTCSVCKKNFSDEKGTKELTDVTVPAAGHKPVADAAVPATCTQDGKTEGSHCAVCGAVLTEPAVIPATGHAYGKWEKLNDAQHQRVCANDSTHVETEDHTWDEGEVTKEATAEAEGETTYTCTVCGATRTEPIDKKEPEEITDPETGITVSFASGAFSAGVTLRVQEVKDGDKLLDEPYSAVTAFDIATFVGDKQVQPKSSVTVKIPIPKGYKVEAIEVYHIAAGGAKEKMSIRVENGYIIFKADSFSIYAVVDTSAKQAAFTPGDVDGDGEVTSGDARLALRASVKLEQYESGSAPFLAADADGNGTIESSDARLILRASVKLEALPQRP